LLTFENLRQLARCSGRSRFMRSIASGGGRGGGMELKRRCWKRLLSLVCESVSLCVCVCVCVHTNIYMYIVNMYIYVHTCIHIVYIYIDIYAYMHTYTIHIHRYICIYIYVLQIHIYRVVRRRSTACGKSQRAALKPNLNLT
jgi:hypothetical protein